MGKLDQPPRHGRGFHGRADDGLDAFGHLGFRCSGGAAQCPEDFTLAHDRGDRVDDVVTHRRTEMSQQEIEFPILHHVLSGQIARIVNNQAGTAFTAGDTPISTGSPQSQDTSG